MKGKTILVTGSAGFIGYHVSKSLLKTGNTVIGIDNINDYYDVSLKEARNKDLSQSRNYIFVKADLSDFDALEKVFKKYTFDKICHLAAQVGVRYSIKNPMIYELSNVKGFLNILELARKFTINDVIYASSSSVYGNTKMKKNGFSERDNVDQPISLYAATKKSDELMAYTYHHLYGLNCTGLRFFTVYGPMGRPDMAYYKFVKAITSDEKIDVYNFGKMKRDFTYIDDVVDGVIKALEKSYAYEIFNIGNSDTVDLTYFINCIEKELGKKAKTNLMPLQPGDVLETYADITNAKDKLGFSPKVKIEEGIHNFVTWYKEYYNC